MNERDPQPIAGALVAQKYRLLHPVGSGSMGSVWAAEHATLKTLFAIKFMQRQLVAQADVRERFDNEAQAAARLSSRHIVKVFDHGVDAGTGRPYIVMELLHGEPLDLRLEREGTLPLAETAQLASDIARALLRVHEAGIVHRDLKPENILLVRDDEDGREYAKLVDFGIAKFAASTGLTSSTETGAVLGTPQYMSPEQARGLRSVDWRSDVWSVGVIVYRCLTGRLPFDGDAVGDVLVKICTQEPAAPSSRVPLPLALDEWMCRSLAKEPSERFESVAEQSAALLRAAQGDPAPALPAPMKPQRRWSWPLLAASVLGFGLAVALAVGNLGFGSPQGTSPVDEVHSEPAPALPPRATADLPQPPGSPTVVPVRAAPVAPREAGTSRSTPPVRKRPQTRPAAGAPAPKTGTPAPKTGTLAPRPGQRPPAAPSASSSIQDELGY